MTTPELGPAPVIVIEQDTIATYEASLREFFADILGMDFDAVLVTDEACLSDFAFSGDYPQGEVRNKTLRQLYDEWDNWVLPRICARYDLEPGSFKTRIRLIALMALIEKRTRAHVH